MTSNQQDGGLLNIKQAAQMLNVSEVSLRRWTQSGELACVRVGPKQERRFRRQDLDAYLRERFAPALATGTVPAARCSHVEVEGLAIEQGSHLCSVYKNDPGRVKLAAPFLSDGLRAGDRCFLVAAGKAKDHLLERLGAVHGSLGDAIASGRLVVSNGKDSGEAMYSYFESAFAEGARSGSGSLRVLGDMAWTLDKGFGIDQLIEFELRYNQFLAHQFPVVTLCQYDARRFSGVGILDALKCHDDTFKYPLGRFLS